MLTVKALRLARNGLAVQNFSFLFFFFLLPGFSAVYFHYKLGPVCLSAGTVPSGYEVITRSIT